MTRVIFLGTPEFAVPTLEALVKAADFHVVGVVTQPDRPAGRGQRMHASAVKAAALRHRLPVFQPKTLNDHAVVEYLHGWKPDVMVVAAFGQILRQSVLNLAPHGCINVHASLLPRWRGAAPIQYAIRAGDEETGITIMKMDQGLDSGPILMRRAIPIAPRETAATLHDKLAQLGAEVLPPALRGYLAREIIPHPQPDQGVTKAPSIKKEAGLIDWRSSAVEIDRQVRAYDPWPGTFSSFEGADLKVLRGHPLPGADSGADSGTLLSLREGLGVACGSGVYVIETLQPAGKKAMSAAAFLAGRPDAIGKRLGTQR